MRESLLEEIGLTKSEIKVYLALLELGSSTTGKIVDKSQASSSKIYEILDKLSQKGLVSFIIKSGKKHFEAASPERIMDYMKEREKKFNQQKQELRKILPELEFKKNLSKYKSEATIYKGLKGLETAMYTSLDLLKAGDEQLSMGLPRRSEAFNSLLVRFNKERARRKIKFRAIYNESAKGDLRAYPENRPLSKAKFMPQTTPSATGIFKDRIVIITEVGEPMAIVIDSKEVAESFRVQFEMWWGQRVQTYEGQKAVENVYDLMIKSAKSNDEVVIFAAKPETKKGADYNVGWNREIRKKVRNVKLLYYGDNEKNRGRAKEISKQGCKTRILPTQQTLPISTVISGDTIINSVWGKKPTAFKIQNKTVADSLRMNFNLLWDQDTTVSHGFEAFETAWTDLFNKLGPNDSYNVFGAAFGVKAIEKSFANYFRNLHIKRIKKGLKSRILFQQGAEKVIKKFGMDDLYSKDLEFRFLPFKREFPVEIFPHKDTTLLLIQKKEPTIITIKNKEITESFINFFETLWTQSKQ